MSVDGSFRQVGRSFAAVAEGIDLRYEPTPQRVHQIEAAVARYGVLVFPGQRLDEVEQDRFIRAFGPGRNGTFKEAAGSNPNFIDVGTVDDEGRPIPLDSPRGEYMLANRLWHTDGSFNLRPIRLTALLARALPPVPPPTEFADMRAAWDELPESRKAELEGLRVVHSILRSREQFGMRAERFDPATLESRPPVAQPLVRVHPFNGRKS
ncbi:MAG: TauD/TfdA dioxygenase family protein, partial [Lautropia sp.]